MTTKQHWILPEGIEEVLPEQAARYEAMRRQLLDLYASWGYELVMPPTIDFIESLLTGTGHDLDLQTFKLVDQLSGRTLGLRADMTPQVARIDARQLQREAPTRLCYIGTVLHTRPESIGDSRSPLQVGAELYGHGGIEAEVEIIELMMQSFALLGIENVYLDLGNVDIYRSLAKQAGLDDDSEKQLFDMLQRKAVTEIDSLLATLELNDDMRAMLSGLALLNGGDEVFERAAQLFTAADDSVKQAVACLQETAGHLRQRIPGIRLHFDLAELQGYHYKTGVVFAAFVPTRGQAIARGGRYDDIGKVFGRARPATGFSTDLKTLSRLAAISTRTLEKIFAPADTDPALQDKIAELRSQGECVVVELPGQSAGAEAMGCARELVREGDSWALCAVKSE